MHVSQAELERVLVNLRIQDGLPAHREIRSEAGACWCRYTVLYEEELTEEQSEAFYDATGPLVEPDFLPLSTCQYYVYWGVPEK